MPEFEGGKPEGGGGFSLKKKVGPLPLWGWGAIGVGILAFLYYRSKNAGGGTPAVLPTAMGATGDANANGNPVGYDALSSQITGVAGQLGTLQQQLAGSMGTTSTSGVTTPATGQAGSWYTSFLGRPADTAGASFWNNQIQSGGALSAFQQLESTPEAQQYAANNPGAVVGAEYTQFLNRPADAAGLAYWTQYLNMNGAAAESAAFLNSARAEQAPKK